MRRQQHVVGALALLFAGVFAAATTQESVIATLQVELPDGALDNPAQAGLAALLAQRAGLGRHLLQQQEGLQGQDTLVDHNQYFVQAEALASFARSLVDALFGFAGVKRMANLELSHHTIAGKQKQQQEEELQQKGGAATGMSTMSASSAVISSIDRHAEALAELARDWAAGLGREATTLERSSLPPPLFISKQQGTDKADDLAVADNAGNVAASSAKGWVDDAVPGRYWWQLPAERRGADLLSAGSEPGAGPVTQPSSSASLSSSDPRPSSRSALEAGVFPLGRPAAATAGTAAGVSASTGASVAEIEDYRARLEQRALAVQLHNNAKATAQAERQRVLAAAQATQQAAQHGKGQHAPADTKQQEMDVAAVTERAEAHRASLAAANSASLRSAVATSDADRYNRALAAATAAASDEEQKEGGGDKKKRHATASSSDAGVPGYYDFSESGNAAPVGGKAVTTPAATAISGVGQAPYTDDYDYGEANEGGGDERDGKHGGDEAWIDILDISVVHDGQALVLRLIIETSATESQLTEAVVLLQQLGEDGQPQEQEQAAIQVPLPRVQVLSTSAGGAHRHAPSSASASAAPTDTAAASATLEQQFTVTFDMGGEGTTTSSSGPVWVDANSAAAVAAHQSLRSLPLLPAGLYSSLGNLLSGIGGPASAASGLGREDRDRMLASGGAEEVHAMVVDVEVVSYSREANPALLMALVAVPITLVALAVMGLAAMLPPWACTRLSSYWDHAVAGKWSLPSYYDNNGSHKGSTKGSGKGCANDTDETRVEPCLCCDMAGQGSPAVCCGTAHSGQCTQPQGLQEPLLIDLYGEDNHEPLMYVAAEEASKAASWHAVGGGGYVPPSSGTVPLKKG